MDARSSRHDLNCHTFLGGVLLAASILHTRSKKLRDPPY
jgi:hypothetical protein